MWVFETLYQEALSIEFNLRKVPFKKEVKLPIKYKDVLLEISYRTDFVCYKNIIVELKAISQLSGTEESQTINYTEGNRIRNRFFS